ncbi:PAS domain-containing protein [Candidatus Woesearchaeota archaeon]|nr:PAS domain-containing protein [Candidatus Woesearchaeota archaeon]
MHEKKIAEKPGKFRSLTITLALAFLFLSTVVLFSSSLINIYFSIQAQQKAIDSYQQMISSEAADSVRNFINEKTNKLETGIKLFDLASVNQDEKKILLERLIGFDQAFRQIIFLDEQGYESVKVTRLSSYATSQLRDKLNDPKFIESIEEDRYISTIYIDELTSEPLIIVSVPVRDIFGDSKGSLMAEVNLKFMWDMVSSIKVGESGVAYVVDNAGYLLAFEDISRILKRENLLYLKEVNEFVVGDVHSHESNADISKGIYGTTVVTTHSHLHDPDWAVVVELPVVEAYENVINQIRLSIVFMVLSLILTVVLGIFLSRKITEPLISLRNAAMEIRKGNLDAKIEPRSKDEIGELSVSFDGMREAVKSQRNKLEDYSKHLEEKVKQRTKQLELRDRKLSESDKRYDLVVKTTGQLVYDLDLDTNNIIWKGAVKEITGYDPKNFRLDLDGWTKYIHPKDRKHALDELDKSMKEKQKYSVDYRFRQKNGTYKYVRDNGFYIEDKTGKAVRMLGTIKDITSQKEYENKILRINRKLEEANLKLTELDKEKDEFISIAAHELKTPLTSIKGFAQLLKTKNVIKDKKKQNHYLDLVNDNTIRLYNLILDLVDSSRLSLGKLDIDIKEVNTIDIFNDVKENMALVIEKSGIKPVFTIEKDLPKLKADPERLLQVIRNLIVNATHFTKEGGTISVGVRRKGRFVEFSVRDDGEGIPKERQDKIFSRFYQADSSLTRKVKGSGLGLSVCKGLVELMEGRIWFESVEGKGTTFLFTIPVAKK